MNLAATTAAEPAQRGRTRITDRSLKRVVSAVTADTLGVDVGRVAVELFDQKGALAVSVTTSIRVVSLDRVQGEPSVVARTGGSIMERTAQAQETIRDQVNMLTGYTIGRVTVRLSGLDIRSEDRVR